MACRPLQLRLHKRQPLFLDATPALEEVLDAVYLAELMRLSLTSGSFVDVAAHRMGCLRAFVDAKDS